MRRAQPHPKQQKWRDEEALSGMQKRQMIAALWAQGGSADDAPWAQGPLDSTVAALLAREGSTDFAPLAKKLVKAASGTGTAE